MVLNKTHSNILTLHFHYQYEKSFSPFHTGETSQPICLGLTFYVQKIKNERRILKESIFGILMFFANLLLFYIQSWLTVQQRMYILTIFISLLA